MTLFTDEQLKVLDSIARSLSLADKNEKKAKETKSKQKEKLWKIADDFAVAHTLRKRTQFEVDLPTKEQVEAHAARFFPAFNVDSIEKIGDTNWRVLLTESPAYCKFSYHSEKYGVRIGRQVSKKEPTFDVTGIRKDHPEIADQILAKTTVETHFPDGTAEGSNTYFLHESSLERFLLNNVDKKELISRYIIPGEISTKFAPIQKDKK